MSASFCMFCGAKLLLSHKFLTCINRACLALSRGGAALSAKFSISGKPLQCHGCSNFLEDKGGWLQCPAATEEMQVYNCTDRYSYSGRVIDAEVTN